MPHMKTQFWKQISIYTWNYISRNPLLSLTTTVVIVLCVFFLQTLTNIQILGDQARDNLNRRIDFYIELDQTADLNDPLIAQVSDKLKVLGLTTRIITKETARDEFLKKLNPDMAEFLIQYKENPLPASIYVDTIPIDSFHAFETLIKDPAYNAVLDERSNGENLDAQKERLKSITQAVSVSQALIFVLMTAFYFLVFVVIFFTIELGLLARSEEIDIMRLVGGPYSVIFLPFIFESVILVLIGAIIGTFLQRLFLFGVSLNTGSLGSLKITVENLIVYVDQHIFQLFFSHAFFLCCVAILGSIIATRHFLVRKEERESVGVIFTLIFDWFYRK